VNRQRVWGGFTSQWHRVPKLGGEPQNSTDEERDVRGRSALTKIYVSWIEAGAAKQGGTKCGDDIYWVCVFKVKPEQFDDFKKLVAPLVYEYNVSDDRTTIHILEHYRNSDAVVSHVQQTFAKFAERFSALATVASFVVYGVPRPEARKILDGFGAIYMTPFDGFTH
jgi:quinol monooxygenase YgiN